jgi:NAD(P)-dependent dehydrogenase (short-subunit alcohol dehydrogenase family)
MVPFAAAKEGLTRALAVDLKPIRVNSVAVGAVHTELLTAMAQSGLPEGAPPEAAEKRMQATLALFKSKALTNTVGQPKDVAGAYLWLMRDRFVTGTVVRSDGGYLLV